MKYCQMTKKTMTTSLLQKLTLPQKYWESEGVGIMGNETEEREIEGVHSETEGVDSDNEGLDSELLPPESKGCSLRNPPNVNYINKRTTKRSMGWKNIIVGSNELHSIAKSLCQCC